MSAIGSFGNYASQGATLASASRNVSVPQGNYSAGASARAYCPTCNGGGSANRSSSSSGYCPTCNGGSTQRSSASLSSATYSAQQIGRSNGSASTVSSYCPTCNGSRGGATAAASSSSQARQGGTLCIACQYNR